MPTLKTEQQPKYGINPPENLSIPKIPENSLEVMKKRHLLKDKSGKLLENPAQMFWRVARSIGDKDEKYLKGTTSRKKRIIERTAAEFYEAMANNQFLPGSRVLFEAGNYLDGTGQLSSCFVLPLEDSLESIFDTMKEAALVQKNNGGTGFNFSHIRPKNDVVGGTPNVAAGPVHFIKTFSQAFDQVLKGKKRGGGNMAILNVNHPDIIEFINLKGSDSSIRNFNISVGISDQFMEALRSDQEYNLINPRTGKPVKKLKAKAVFDLICEKAWQCADPGIFFLDTAQNVNPTPNLGIIEATNPCGEEPLRAYESCNLGSVVLPTHLKKIKGSYQIDWDLLAKTVHTGIHFLDNMIDYSRFPLKKIAMEVEKTRKLGLGVVGLGSMLYQMAIPYNSQKAIDLTKEIIRFIQENAIVESSELAKERGVFPGFKGSLWDKLGKRVRNATMSSVAPTGTLSLVADTSSGIEPVFSLVYARRSFYQDEGVENKKMLLYVNKEFEAYAKQNKFYSEELMQQIAENNGTLYGIKGIPDIAKEVFVTTHDIAPGWHVKMQAAAQKNIDAAVSKTINLPFSATVEDIRKSYIEAWQTGCKGITIYRDGSKSSQVLETVQRSQQPDQKNIELNNPENLLAPNALQVLEKRALLKDKHGNVTETPEDLWHRIAKYLVSKETTTKSKIYEKEFFEIMNQGEFLSGGTLLWAGMGKDTILSKCLVLPIGDSIDSIFQTLNWNIQCLRRGVGTGFNFSPIRSTYARVGPTGEFAAGPVEYIKMFNRAQDTIRGKGGRGLGSMAILNADHPNIEDFIEAKDDLVSITHYNISVGASDKFMKAVKNDEDWNLIDPHDKKIYKTLKARALFEKIARHAWNSGDPGIYFIDSAQKGNNTPELGEMDATNPCGEQPLLPFETCNLGNINLSKMVIGFPFASDPDYLELNTEKKLAAINWKRLEEVTKLGVRYLDNIIDINNYPIKEIEEMTRRTRNIGVGIMGLADFFIKLGVVYGSEESITIVKKVMKFINEKTDEASQQLGKEKGNFPAFNQSNWLTKGYKNRRNVRTTTIAPTGTISIIANCNPGIEPVFSLGYRRKNSMGGLEQEVIEPLLEIVAKARGFYAPGLIKAVADGAHLEDLEEKFGISEDVVKVFKTTHEIDPEAHVQIQAAFQKHVESAVSKTINLSESAKWQDIAKMYTLAYDLGCKGITVFRDGSKDPALQVGIQKSLVSSPQASAISAPSARNTLVPLPRADVYKGYTYSVKTEQGNLYVTINEDERGIAEVFLNLGKSGSYTAGYTQAIGRLISMALRAGVKPEAVIDPILGIRTSAPTMNKGMIVYSVPDAVAKVLKKHLEEKKNQMKLLEVEAPVLPTALAVPVLEKVVTEKPVASTVTSPVEKSVIGKVAIPVSAVKETKNQYTSNNKFGDLLECPECGSDLEYAEGCILCRSCGFSKCG